MPETVVMGMMWLPLAGIFKTWLTCKFRLLLTPFRIFPLFFGDGYA